MGKARLLSGFYWLVLAILLFIAGTNALSMAALPGGARLFIVESGSMAPAIPVGSLVVIQKQASYQEGDIVTVRVGNNLRNPTATVTHRIVRVENTDRGVTYLTKGDANQSADMTTRTPDSILGKVALSVPFVGYPLGFAKTQTGFILLIIIPATIVIYGELVNIKTEAGRLLAERRRRKLSAAEEAEVKVGEEIIALEKDIKKIQP